MATEESSERNGTLKAGYICGETPMMAAMLRGIISGAQKSKHTQTHLHVCKSHYK